MQFLLLQLFPYPPYLPAHPFLIKKQTGVLKKKKKEREDEEDKKKEEEEEEEETRIRQNKQFFFKKKKAKEKSIRICTDAKRHTHTQAFS